MRGKRFLQSSPEIPDAPRATKRVQNSALKESADLSGMPTDVIYNVTSFLDAKSLLNMRVLNRSFRVIASHNSAGWDLLCENLWKTKVHVRAEARNCTDRMAAYRLSVEDAQNRDHLLPEELIYDLETRTGTIWSFRFKESAGEVGTSVSLFCCFWTLSLFLTSFALYIIRNPLGLDRIRSLVQRPSMSQNGLSCERKGEDDCSR